MQSAANALGPVHVSPRGHRFALREQALLYRKARATLRVASRARQQGDATCASESGCPSLVITARDREGASSFESSPARDGKSAALFESALAHDPGSLARCLATRAVDSVARDASTDRRYPRVRAFILGNAAHGSARRSRSARVCV